MLALVLVLILVLVLVLLLRAPLDLRQCLLQASVARSFVRDGDVLDPDVAGPRHSRILIQGGDDQAHVAVSQELRVFHLREK